MWDISFEVILKKICYDRIKVCNISSESYERSGTHRTTSQLPKETKLSQESLKLPKFWKHIYIASHHNPYTNHKFCHSASGDIHSIHPFSSSQFDASNLPSSV